MYSEMSVTGSTIEKLCDSASEDCLRERTAVIQAAKSLLTSVTRVLLLADVVVVKQLLLAKDKVLIPECLPLVTLCCLSVMKPMRCLYVGHPRLLLVVSFDSTGAHKIKSGKEGTKQLKRSLESMVYFVGVERKKGSLTGIL